MVSMTKAEAGLAPPVGAGAYAVVFTSRRTEGDHGYAQTSDEMVALAATQPGFLGLESAREAEGLGITISYWRDSRRSGSGRRTPTISPRSAPGASAGTAPIGCAYAEWSASTASSADRRRARDQGRPGAARFSTMRARSDSSQSSVSSWMASSCVPPRMSSHGSRARRAST